MTVDTEQTNESNIKKRPINWGKIGIFITTLGLVIFVFGFVYGYYEVSKVNMALVSVTEKLAEKDKNNQDVIQTLQNTITDLKSENEETKSALTKQQQTLSEYQQAQQGDTKKWYLAEVQYLLKQANDALQFNQDPAMALIYAERANALLQNLNDPNLLEIRKSLANDITQIQSAPQVDVTDTYLKVLSLKAQIAKLPFPENALQNSDKQTPTAQTNPPDQSWWRRTMHATWQSLQKVVVVKKMDDKQAIIFPDKRPFIILNLEAQTEAVLWAILNRDQAIFTANLKRIQDWVQTYFAVNDPTTKSFLDAIQKLQQVNLTPPNFNLADTMKLLDANSVNQTKQ